MSKGFNYLLNIDNPQNTLDTLKAIVLTLFSLKPLYLLILSLSLIYSLFNLLKVIFWNHIFNIYRLDLLFFGIISPVILFFTFLSIHFWTHYIHIINPFLAFNFNLVAFGLAKMFSKKNYLISNKFCSIMISIFLIVLIPEINETYKYLNSILFSEKNDIEFLEKKEFLQSKNIYDQILLPSDMYYHFKNGIARGGFPHSAHFFHIENGWWEKSNFSDSLNLPTRKEELCKMLNENGPKYIAEYEILKAYKEDTSFVYSCLTKNESNYQIYDSIKISKDKLFILFKLSNL